MDQLITKPAGVADKNSIFNLSHSRISKNAFEVDCDDTKNVSFQQLHQSSANQISKNMNKAESTKFKRRGSRRRSKQRGTTRCDNA